MREQTQEMPILLLDDVVSELDQHRSEFLLEHVTHAEQVLITTTDLKHYRREFLASTALWQVIAGMVRPLEGPLSEASAPQPG
jgi:DNA replication and repair protein RecF